MNTASIVATSPPLNICIELSSCCPRPPAPTKPSTTEERIAHSHRYTVYELSSAAFCGSSA
jgi:hypothetical protein